jgi:biopolymer transport protein ExbD
MTPLIILVLLAIFTFVLSMFNLANQITYKQESCNRHEWKTSNNKMICLRCGLDTSKSLSNEE